MDMHAQTKLVSLRYYLDLCGPASINVHSQALQYTLPHLLSSFSKARPSSQQEAALTLFNFSLYG